MGIHIDSAAKFRDYSRSEAIKKKGQTRLIGFTYVVKHSYEASEPGHVH